jgi:hypothetical protein
MSNHEPYSDAPAALMLPLRMGGIYLLQRPSIFAKGWMQMRSKELMGLASAANVPLKPVNSQQ